ncbi:phosphoglycerate mutase-like protein [Aspergillus sclerotioniger CBS 115572]|uniref:Phosphoglycerate mutase-like protein n=1 Tax=Aspergillus sclerotioniger CBS 115572 TaxID=1450535 RepID=A0A317WLJ5_9EURO|nr:phosphoglycerate mutase-like protein [Aspergillus sclerotioniger CBS 115572]PWY85888.1 phosphoglycerate mutase-like protein [Aspergillus sclerotioniger CBS 115572]
MTPPSTLPPQQAATSPGPPTSSATPPSTPTTSTTRLDTHRLPLLPNQLDRPITDDHLEKLTLVGLQEATTLGYQFRQRYPHLHTNKIWSSTAERTTKSAQGFISGYTNNQTHMDLISVPEIPATAVPTKIPSQKPTPPLITRLNHLAPTFNFTSSDITAMFELCGYETVIRGSSPFCSPHLFTPTEWLSFEYANDLMYFHNTGYGRPLSPVLGFPWVNASYSLLASNTSDQDIYVSFTHREVPPTVVTALGLFNNSAYSGRITLMRVCPWGR